jgi:ABC-type transport system involved in multi-copper enzyme maturation permease subunit
MPSKTTPAGHPREAGRPAGYHSPFGQEVAPSDVRADEPRVARLIGVAGLCAVFFGVVVVGVNWWAVSHKWETRPLFPEWVGYMAVIFGIGGLLFHAARDAEVQARRSYGAAGALLVLLAVAFAFVPTAEHLGGWFLPVSVPAFLLGLFFLLPFAHNEDDLVWRRNVVIGVTVIGVAMALTGLVGGSISGRFLLPFGAVAALIGLVYLWASVGLIGSAGEWGYRLALGLGILGGLVIVAAIVRSIVGSHYFVPDGLTLIGLGILYVFLSVGICSERQVVVLTRRELAGYFYSPIAYLVLFGMTLIGWIMYWAFVGGLIEDARSFQPHQEPIVREYIVALVPVMCVVFVVPVLTMRLLSEERRTGTIEVMLTAPVDEVVVVIGKFIAALVFFLVLWVPWGLFLISLRVEGGQPFDFLPLLSFYVSLVASGAGFVGMGLFFSSLTRNQIVSAVLTFMGMMFLLCFFLLRQMTAIGPDWSAFFKELSFVDLWIQSTSGMLYVRDLVLWLSLAVFWLFLTVKVLESRKWK